MDCRTALEILDCQGAGPSELSERDLAAAERHLADCGRCRAIVQNRRRLDRKIGRVLRAVDVPRVAQEQVIEQLSALETVALVDKTPAAGRSGDNLNPTRATSGAVDEPAGAMATTVNLSQAPAESPHPPGERPRRRVWRGFVPVAACLAVAAIGFFGVVWLMTPHWSVEEVRQQLARIDFDSLDSLPAFRGKPGASRLPTDPGWQKLDWRGGRVAKGWPDVSRGHQFAVYGFVLPGRQRENERRGQRMRGLLAVIPRRQMRAPPEDASLMTAQSSDYLSARIGESVSVAWTDGDMVYVCLVEGGEDSLATLRQMLGASAA